MDILESCFPYSLLRNAYHQVYKVGVWLAFSANSRQRQEIQRNKFCCVVCGLKRAYRFPFRNALGARKLAQRPQRSMTLVPYSTHPDP
jgi:hypothetical protein